MQNRNIRTGTKLYFWCGCIFTLVGAIFLACFILMILNWEYVVANSTGDVTLLPVIFGIFCALMLTLGISLISWYHRDKRRILSLIQTGYYVTAELIGFPINRRHRINNIPMYYAECIYRDPMTGKEYYFQSGDIGLVTNRMVNHQHPPQNQTVRVYVDPNHDYRNYYVDIDSIR